MIHMAVIKRKAGKKSYIDGFKIAARKIIKLIGIAMVPRTYQFGFLRSRKTIEILRIIIKT